MIFLGGSESSDEDGLGADVDGRGRDEEDGPGSVVDLVDASRRRILSLALGLNGKIPHFLNPFWMVEISVLPKESRNMAVKLVLFKRMRFFCPRVASWINPHNT